MIGVTAAISILTNEVEFTQEFFPSRIRSLNDIYAEMVSATDTVSGTGEWEYVNLEVDAGHLGLDGDDGWLTLPVYLTIQTPHAGDVVDIDNITLSGEFGGNQLQNRNFEKGRSHWFFTQDDHLLCISKTFLFKSGSTKGGSSFLHTPHC